MDKEKMIKDLEEKIKKYTVEDCEVYSRIVGYYRPVQQWNPGKEQEWLDRLNYDINSILGRENEKIN